MNDMNIQENTKSTYEELKSANAALHAANADLSKINAELQAKVAELTKANQEISSRQNEALLASEERFRTLADLAPASIHLTSPDGQSLYVNKRGLEMMGLSPEEAKGTGWIKSIHPDDLSSMISSWTRFVASGGQGGGIEYRLRTPEGKITWVYGLAAPQRDAQGNIVAYVGINTDITERKLAEEALYLKNLVFDASLAANSITNSEGTLTEANDMFLRLWGYSDKIEVLGKPIHEFISDSQVAKDILKTLNESGKWTGDFTAKRKDGSTFEAQSISSILRDKTGKIIGYQSSAMDVTTQKKAEYELQNFQKLKSIGTLAGGIAHDFNNIMMGLFGNISLAKDELPPDHPCCKILENAEKSMSRASRLAMQLLTFSKGGNPVKENVNLAELVKEVAQFDLTGSAIMLEYQGEDNLWLAKVDRGQIQQVISNLTINARQAMPHGGHLFITLENSTIQQENIPNLTPGKYIKATVRDEGTGIEPKNLNHIFEPYFTTKRTGNGLGLATTYSIISKHGGHIDVTSELNQGTTFTIYLPASAEPLSSEVQSSPARPVTVKPNTKVLVLDDEEFIRMIIPRWLKKQGCVVETSGDGRECIEKYQTSLMTEAPFNVLILDLTLPGSIGGVDVLKEILALDPTAKAIVSSGYAEGEIMANFALCGFKGMITKPYTETQLQEILAKVSG